MMINPRAGRSRDHPICLPPLNKIKTSATETTCWTISLRGAGTPGIDEHRDCGGSQHQHRRWQPQSRRQSVDQDRRKGNSAGQRNDQGVPSRLGHGLLLGEEVELESPQWSEIRPSVTTSGVETPQ